MATASHEHSWRRVYPVVSVIGERGKTFNAVCDCGSRAWVHWPEPLLLRPPR